MEYNGLNKIIILCKKTEPTLLKHSNKVVVQKVTPMFTIPTERAQPRPITMQPIAVDSNEMHQKYHIYIVPFNT